MLVRLRVASALALSTIIGLAVAAAPTHVSAATACKTDATDGCERDGVKCDPPEGGKCVTIKTPVPLSGPKLSCECRVPANKAVILSTSPCLTAQGREELLRTGGQHALEARCGHTQTTGHGATHTTGHTNLPPPGYN